MSADPSNAPSTALRTSRFSFREPALLFPRVRLYPGRLVLDGWHWHGRFCRQIPLGHILQVDVTSTGFSISRFYPLLQSAGPIVGSAFFNDNRPRSIQLNSSLAGICN